MSGCIDYMLDVIQREIPAKLLDIVFKPKPQHGDLNIPVSRREMIRQEVINKWVLADINTQGVQNIHVPLSTAIIRDTGINQKVISFPRSATGNRRILKLSSMGFFNPYAHTSVAGIGVMSGTEMQMAVSKMLASNAQIPRVETGYVSIISENTFLVEDLVNASPTYWVGLTLESDEWLSMITPPYFVKFGEFAVAAARAVIYRYMTDNRDGVVMEGGHELGSLNDMVNNWSDAVEIYNDIRRQKLNKWLLLNDKNAHRAHVKMLAS